MFTDGRRGCRAVLGVMAIMSMISVAVGAENPAAGAQASAREAVEATEIAFARTMADRDFDAFKRFLSTEAVFFAGDTALRGADAVAAAWKPYFEGEDPPFSWRPETVEVLDSGTLALSSGPVHDPDGRRVGTFNSIWRKNASGEWRIVFDKGATACED